MSVSVQRTFGHTKYQLVDSGYSGYGAKSEAKKLRNRGFYVRSVKLPDGGFALYRRHKYPSAH